MLGSSRTEPGATWKWLSPQAAVSWLPVTTMTGLWHSCDIRNSHYRYVYVYVNADIAPMMSAYSSMLASLTCKGAISYLRKFTLSLRN